MSLGVSLHTRLFAIREDFEQVLVASSPFANINNPTGSNSKVHYTGPVRIQIQARMMLWTESNEGFPWLNFNGSSGK